MAKFRKKPVVIEAVQFDGGNYGDCYAFCPTIFWEKGIGVIPTLEGDMKVQREDWIIRGVKGEFYPCKPDIFEATYGAAIGCGVCADAMTEIRSRYPGEPRRQVCPTCLADRMDQIRDVASPDYGVACEAQPLSSLSLETAVVE